MGVTVFAAVREVQWHGPAGLAAGVGSMSLEWFIINQLCWCRLLWLSTV